MIEENISNDEFKLWRKWFWVGIIMSLLFSVPGIIYGIALALEKEHRKEGLIIIIFSVLWYFALSFIITELTLSGALPRYQVLQL